MSVQPIQPISGNMLNPYHFYIYLKNRKKRIIETKITHQLKQDTVEISKEGMELYLKSINKN